MANIRNAGGRVLEAVGSSADTVAKVLSTASSGVDILHNYVNREAMLQQIHGDESLLVRIKEKRVELTERVMEAFEKEENLKQKNPERYQAVMGFMQTPLTDLIKR